jgi:hypothetical protein
MTTSFLYKIHFLKRTAKLNKECAKAFALDILKEFGGLSLLSNVTIVATDESTFKINCEKDSVKSVQAAFATQGSYQEMKCCIREVETQSI